MREEKEAATIMHYAYLSFLSRVGVLFRSHYIESGGAIERI